MPLLYYTLIRLGLFAAFFTLYLLIDAGLLMSVICALVSAIAVAYIFFPKLHAGASAELARFFKRTPKPQPAENIKDAATQKEGDQPVIPWQKSNKNP